MNKRARGAAYEQMAMDLAAGEGAVPVAMNVREGNGEVDLIFRDGKYLVFAEVKYRADETYGSAEAAVNRAKQKKICQVCRRYLVRKHLGTDTPVRFDVFAITDGTGAAAKIHWIRDAFPYQI